MNYWYCFYLIIQLGRFFKRLPDDHIKSGALFKNKSALARDNFDQLSFVPSFEILHESIVCKLNFSIVLVRGGKQSILHTFTELVPSDLVCHFTSCSVLK